MNTNNGGGDPDFAGARRNFEEVWNPSRSRSATWSLREPSIRELLELDQEYRRRVKQVGRSSRRGLRVERNQREYVVRYALLEADDQQPPVVVIDVDTPLPGRRYMVITGRQGSLAGRRLVRGRELDCLRHYNGRLTGS